MDESPQDRRKDGWSWAKEIVGTMVGVVGVLAIPSGWLFVTINGMQITQALHAVEIAHLKESRTDAMKKSDSIDDKLAKILEQVNEIKVQAARGAK